MKYAIFAQNLAGAHRIAGARMFNNLNVFEWMHAYPATLMHLNGSAHIQQQQLECFAGAGDRS